MKRLAICAMSAMFVIAAIGMITTVPETVSAAPSANEFRVDSDVELAAEADSGAGTEGDPWVIESREINGFGYDYGIYIGNTTEHFVIRGCHIWNVTESANHPYYVSAGIHLYNVQNAIISNNAINETATYGIYLSNNTDSVSVHNNTIWNCNLRGIAVLETDNCRFNDNTLYGNYTCSLGFSFDGWSDNHALNRNTIQDFGWVGIVANDTWNTTFTENEIIGFNMTMEPDPWYGPEYGIFVYNSRWVYGYDNNITDCNVGLNVTGGSMTMRWENNTITGGYVQDFVSHGIQVFDVDTTVLFTNNTVTGADVMALDPSGEALWNSSTHGNWWGDYTGSDTNGDGIGQTSYIFTDNTDYYPLCTAYTTPAAVGGGVPSATTTPPVSDAASDPSVGGWDLHIGIMFWAGLGLLFLGFVKFPVPYIQPHILKLLGAFLIILNFVWG